MKFLYTPIEIPTEHGNRPTKHAKLGPFRPIRDDIPKWITGPALIAAAVPERLLFAPYGPNEIGIDYGGLADLCEVAPGEDRDAYMARLESVANAIADRLSTFEMAEFIG